MNDPVKFEAFFTEADYPEFVALFPDELPPTYDEFVARVDQRIKEMMEHVTIEKATVSYAEFIAECTRREEPPNYEIVHRIAFRVWGRNNGYSVTD